MAAILYFDCLSGASGDMILASLVDLGVPVAYLNRKLGRLRIPGLKVSTRSVRRGGIECRMLDLAWKAPKEYRHIEEILSIVRRGRFGEAVFGRCAAVLDRLAMAESKAHGIPKSHVHFHEIGAVDTIIDIAGTCLATEYLKVDSVRFSTLTEGYGTITTEHGVMPVPAPATANLVKGFRLRRVDVPTELLTPTGAALLTTLGTQAAACPDGTVRAIGHGCGRKVLEGHPNYLRAFLVETEERRLKQCVDTVAVLESDMDHISGEIMGNAAGVLLEKGALDVSWTPVFMKKGRAGYRLTVIAPPKKAGELADLVMAHTRTLGVRVQTVERIVAQRSKGKSRLLGREITVKQCRHKNLSFKKPEYEDLARISREKGIPVIELMERF